MSEWVEWDAFPDPPKRRRRPKIEVLPPQEPESRIRVDVQHYHHQRRSNQLPPWLPFAVIGFLIALRFLPAIGIALVVIVALMFAYPIIGIIVALWVGAVVIIAIVTKRRGKAF
jgi:hypothetical protein